MKKSKNTKFLLIQVKKCFFGVGAFHSKYVIVGCGYSGYTLSKLMTSDNLRIPGEQITIIDPIEDYTIYPNLKFHCYGKSNLNNKQYKFDDILPSRVKYRQNEILELDPEKNLLLGDLTLRQSYDKLIIASGLEPDFFQVSGLLYSLQDYDNPIFSTYEYSKSVTKMCLYSMMLLFQVKNVEADKFSQKTLNFLTKGDGNIVYSNMSSETYDIIENIQMIILLFDLIKQNRSREFLSTINFIICLPVDMEIFISESPFMNTFFIKQLQVRGIVINWNYMVKEIKANHVISFSNGEKLIDIEYGFSLVFPKLSLPSYIRYSSIFKSKENLEYNRNDLSVNGFKNIFLIGESLSSKNYLDRHYINIYNQAEVLANNLKSSQYRLGEEKLKKYSPKFVLNFNYDLNQYTAIDTQNNRVKYLKKGYWNNFLFKHFYFRPEGYYTRNILMKKIAVIK